VLAYLFWHRPHEPAAVEDYERAQVSFHRSLARSPPVGLCGSAVFRVAELPWPVPPAVAGEAQPPARGPAYEDWYVVEDFAALGVLNEAAVGRGHRTSHDDLARRAGAGSGGLYALLEGDRRNIRDLGGPLGGASLATWVQRPAGSPRPMLGELLGDGMDPRHASLWRRQLVLGPAPEFCLLAHETPPGAAPTRLPAGWTTTVVRREVLWNG
jgi:hypothetical protein